MNNETTFEEWWNAYYPNNYSDHKSLAEDAYEAATAAAQEREKKLVEALEFYAAEENYSVRQMRHAVTGTLKRVVTPIILDDQGTKAREALLAKKLYETHAQRGEEE